MTGTIVYSGALAQVPRIGGLAWFHLQFLLGFKALGWRVLFLDRIDDSLRGVHSVAYCVQQFTDVLRRFGLENDYALKVEGEWTGRPDVTDVVNSADAFINVMGYCEEANLLALAKRRVFLDIDPGFPQMWKALGLHDAFAGHDRFATLALNIGQPACTIPTCNLPWITLRQPVLLDHWPLTPPRGDRRWTSLGAWRGPNGPVEYHGVTYGLRCHDFRSYFDLPSRCRTHEFEQAMQIHAGDVKDLAALWQHGWHIVNPASVAGTPETYREYIQNSKAEFVVPKQMYSQTNSGLLSDRSVYYLATGRPVLARDTGLTSHYPLGRGLVTFTNPDEAAAGVQAIHSDYDRHCAAARAIAADLCDARRVLPKFLDEVLS